MPSLDEAISVLNAPARSKAFAEETLLPMMQRIRDTLAQSGIKTECGIMQGSLPIVQIEFEGRRMGILRCFVDAGTQTIRLQTWDFEEVTIGFETLTEEQLSEHVARGLLISSHYPDLEPPDYSLLSGARPQPWTQELAEAHRKRATHH